MAAKFKTPNNMVWHYAPWAHLPAIVRSGALTPSNAVATEERPLLWFSANKKWEPTATKLLTTSAGLIQMTFKQQAEQFGCIRFGLSADDTRLLNWMEACSAGGTTKEKRLALEKTGKRMGGDPKHWFAIATEVQLTELHFQLWAEGWHDTTGPKDMSEVWTKARG